MGKGEKQVPELVRAAQALEDELTTLEALSRSVRKIRLDTDKSIARAAKELNEALAVPERLAGGLRAMAEAMSNMQARQQAALEPLAASAVNLQERMNLLGAHMQAFAELGRAAGEVTAKLQADGAFAPTSLVEVKAQLTKIADGARSLCESTRSDDFPDVARESDALRQRILAVRRRLEGDA
jgi:chromosome segregation ATPase